jgi:glycosyltransferase involved in cell wall biosynthesis
VMDGGSTDGTVEWLASQNISWVSEKDRGMYNALNKAIAKSKGEIIGHLNCDEQYLPGVLQFVSDFFEKHGDVDFIAADFLITDPSGKLLAFRKAFQPRWPYFFSNYLYTNTCTLFYRRKIFQKCKFDESYKSIADVIFLSQVLRNGFKGMHVRKYFAAFTYSGLNLSLNPISAVEKRRYNKTLPVWFRLIKPFIKVFFILERIAHGNYFEKPSLTFAVYTPGQTKNRTVFTENKPTFRLNFVAKTTTN